MINKQFNKSIIMTVIIGTIWPGGHLVSSDGRVIADDVINNDAFDKTFSLYGGLLKGAYSNSMNFNLSSHESSKSITEHVLEIIPDEISSGIQNLIELIVKGLEFRLSRAEIIQTFPMEKRNLNLILTGQEYFNYGDYLMYDIRFSYKEDTKSIGHTEIVPILSTNYHCLHHVHAPDDSGLQGKIIENLNKDLPSFSYTTIGKAHFDSIRFGLHETELFYKDKICPVGGIFYSKPQYMPQIPL